MIPNSYETILDKIKQDWFMAGWEACEKEFSIKEKLNLPTVDNRYMNYEAEDTDWGTSDSDCLHKNFPCEHCGANLGEAWEEGF